MYSLSKGLHSTLPTRTPSRTSSKRRPRFSPKIVSLVPPCRGPVSGDSYGKTEDGRLARAIPGYEGLRKEGSWAERCTYLKDLGVSATAAAMTGMHPGSRKVDRAVWTQGAAALGHAPATFKARVSFKAEATAFSQGWTFVEVGCRGKHCQLGQVTNPPPVPPHPAHPGCSEGYQ